MNIINVTYYVAEDGQRFTVENECKAYEADLNKTNEIMSILGTNEPIINNSGIAIKHDPNVVKIAMRRFLLEVCKPAFSDSEYGKQIIQEVADGERHPSHVARFLDDTSYKGKLYNNTFFRFECINMESGLEYCQPYYACNESDFKGKVIDPKFD